jgi:hypothetical protein
METSLVERGYYPLWNPLDFSKGNPNHYDRGFGVDLRKILEHALRDAPTELRKAADTVSVGPLIRQDLDPEVYELYVKTFPLYDMLAKIPANGLVHAYNQETSYGSAKFMGELDTVTDDANTYARATANIAILATRRGISLKAGFAVTAGGVNYDPEAREIAGGLKGIRHQMQLGICRLQDSDPASITATAPNGLYDANAFNSLRYIIQNQSPAGNTVKVVPGTGQPLTIGIRAAANAIIDAGGEPNMIISGVQAKEDLINEQLPQVRFNTVEVIPGLHVSKVAAGESELPIMTIPGDSMGTWIGGGHTYRDMYVVDSSTLALAYLGGPGPTVLEIPVGVGGDLRKLFIPFLMNGLVAFAPLYLARVSEQIA